MEEPSVGEATRERGVRSFVRYAFFKVAREWRFLDEAEKEKGRQEFLISLRKFSDSVHMRFYSLVGIRGDADFMILANSRNLENFQSLTSEILATLLGRYLELPYSYLAMLKKSPYLGPRRREGQDAEAFRTFGGFSKYLFVYPFVKRREWYRLPFAERQRMMVEHFKIGHRYPGVRINTGYSYGLDDQEFVLAFEGDNPSDFLDLVEELRSSEASAYTQLETPTFTCLAVTPEKMLELIG